MGFTISGLIIKRVFAHFSNVVSSGYSAHTENINVVYKNAMRIWHYLNTLR